MYGGIVEMMNNNELFYRSSVNSGYSNWTDMGKIELQEFISSFTVQILESQERELNKRAKEMVVTGLKGEKI